MFFKKYFTFKDNGLALIHGEIPHEVNDEKDRGHVGHDHRIKLFCNMDVSFVNNP